MNRSEITPGVKTPLRSRGVFASDALAGESVRKSSTTGFCPGAKFVTLWILMAKPGRTYVSWSAAR